MVLWFRKSGVWTKPKDIYVKNAGVWKSAQTVRQRQAGVWQIMDNNVIPPIQSVMVNLEMVTGTSPVKHRYFHVGVNLSDAADNPNLDSIDVLVSKSGYPSSPNSQGWVTQAADRYPDEEWSNFKFGGNSTNVEKWKNYPAGASPEGGDVLAGGTTFYVSAFPKDIRGVYGDPTKRAITTPTDFSDNGVRKLIARFTPTTIQTLYGNDGVTWIPDRYDVGTNNGDNVYFFYGNNISSTLGTFNQPTVTQAQLYLYRNASDGIGPAGAANVWSGEHTMTAPTTDVDFEVLNNSFGQTQLGTLLSGEGKWFDLPDGQLDVLADNSTKGILLHASGNPTNLSNQYRLTKTERIPRQGELQITWTET